MTWEAWLFLAAFVLVVFLCWGYMSEVLYLRDTLDKLMDIISEAPEK